MRTVWAILIALAAIAVAPNALAVGPRPSPPPRVGMEMEFTREPTAKDCPPLSTMRLFLINEYAYDPFDLSREDVHIHVKLTLSLKGGVYHGEYTIVPADGEASPVQKMDHPRCSELLQNIASAIPIDTFILFPAPRQQPPPLPALPPPAAPLPSAPAAPSSTQPRMPPLAKRADKPPETHPPASRSLWVAGVEPAVAFGLVPGVALGGRGFVARQWDSYSAGVAVRGFASVAYATEALARRSGTFFDVTLVPCRKLTPLSAFAAISLCASIGLGTETLGIPKTVYDNLHHESTPTHAYYSLEVGARGQVEWPLGGRFALGASVEIGTRVWSRTASVPSAGNGADGAYEQSIGYGTIPQVLTPIVSGGVYWSTHM